MNQKRKIEKDFRGTGIDFMFMCFFFHEMKKNLRVTREKGERKDIEYDLIFSFFCFFFVPFTFFLWF